MALAAVGQADFGAGIYRGREAPDNAAYDLLNLLIDDEGQPFRRGGSAYKSNADATGTLDVLFDAATFGGPRTLFSSATNGYVLSADDATPSATPFTTDYGGPITGRPVSVGGYVFMPITNLGVPIIAGFAGGRKVTYQPGGGLTQTFTNGSKTVNSTGGTFLSSVEKGMLVAVFNGAWQVMVIETVNSNTQLTLRDAVTIPTAASGIYWSSLHGVVFPDGPGTLPAGPYILGSVQGRLIIATGNRAYFSDAATPFVIRRDNYHELPSGASIIGSWTVQDILLLFTAEGVWGISNMAFDALDDAGNVQHIITKLSDVILWGNGGIAGMRDAVVVPAVDDVHLMAPDSSSQPISEGIRPLYRSYVNAGYQPGIAAVHRGHYFLPILSGTTLVDVLVCRLDRDFAWTRKSGHGAGLAYAQRIGSATRSPKLLATKGLRVLELTDIFSPSVANASEADGTTHPTLIDTRDYPTPAGRQGSTTKQLRVRYEATAAGAVSVTAKFSRGPEGSSYTSLTNLRGGAAADGLDESVWSVVRKAPAIRFRIESVSALSSFTLRSIEARYTQSGVQ